MTDQKKVIQKWMIEIIIEDDEENEDEEEEGGALERRIKRKADCPGATSVPANQSLATTIQSIAASSDGSIPIPSAIHSFAPSPTAPGPIGGPLPSLIPSVPSLRPLTLSGSSSGPLTHPGSSSSPSSFTTHPITQQGPNIRII